MEQNRQEGRGRDWERVKCVEKKRKEKGMKLKRQNRRNKYK